MSHIRRATLLRPNYPFLGVPSTAGQLRAAHRLHAVLGLVAARLGHSKVEMALDVYAHALPNQEWAAADRLSYGASAGQRDSKHSSKAPPDAVLRREVKGPW
jgi:hypothetical protein